MDPPPAESPETEVGMAIHEPRCHQRAGQIEAGDPTRDLSLQLLGVPDGPDSPMLPPDRIALNPGLQADNAASS
jgi:hypothetical protein